HGVHLHGRTVEISGPQVAFGDGGRVEPRTVIRATGCERDHSWVHAPVFDATGRLVHERGVTASPGLYFLGLPWQHTRGSALVGWGEHDAQHVAGHIATLASTGTPPAPELAAQPPQR